MNTIKRTFLLLGLVCTGCSPLYRTYVESTSPDRKQTLAIQAVCLMGGCGSRLLSTTSSGSTILYRTRDEEFLPGVCEFLWGENEVAVYVSNTVGPKDMALAFERQSGRKISSIKLVSQLRAKLALRYGVNDMANLEVALRAPKVIEQFQKRLDPHHQLADSP